MKFNVDLREFGRADVDAENRHDAIKEAKRKLRLSFPVAFFEGFASVNRKERKEPGRKRTWFT